MPRHTTRDLRQHATLWVATGRDSYGEVTVTTPVEIKCRWLWGAEEQVKPDGTTVTLDAKVYVDRRIKIGSLLWLGRLTDVPGSTFGDQENGLVQVISYGDNPDVKVRQIRRWVGVMRYKDRLP